MGYTFNGYIPTIMNTNILERERNQFVYSIGFDFVYGLFIDSYLLIITPTNNYIEICIYIKRIKLFQLKYLNLIKMFCICFSVVAIFWLKKKYMKK